MGKESPFPMIWYLVIAFFRTFFLLLTGIFQRIVSGSRKNRAGMQASHTGGNSISMAYAIRVLPADILANQQSDLFWQVHLFQLAEIYVRSSNDFLIFPVTVCDAIHDAVHACVY